jgi:hypothetical protein
MKKLISLLAVFATIATFAQVPSYVPTNGLVGYWPFNGNANDESGNGNNGTVISGLLSNDRLGNANSSYYLNGQTDYIAVPSVSSLLPNRLTMSVWVKIPSIYTGNNQVGRIIRTRFYGYILWFDSSNGSIIHTLHHNSSATTTTNTPSNINDNQWHQIIGTFDGTNNKLYLDGQLISTDVTTTLSNLYYVPDGPVVFGRDGNNPSSETALYQGWIDDIGIWNRALTQQEITTMYNSVEVPTYSDTCNNVSGSLTQGLVGYWPFCGNANDDSGHGNNGTVNGAKLTTDRFGNSNSAYDFDGLSNYIQIPNSNSLQNINEISISAWINISQLYQSGGTGFFPIICKSNLQVGGNLDFLISNPNILVHLNSQYTTASFPVSFNTWQNVVATISNGTTKFYLNGNLLWSGVSGISDNQANNLPLVIGMDKPGLVEYANGKIDDVGIWNRALSQQEITQLYNQNQCFTNTTVTDTLIINVGQLSYTNPIFYANNITLYPNPANTQVNISFTNITDLTGGTIKVVNSLGQQVATTPITLSGTNTTMPLTTWGGTGLYFVQILNAQGIVVDVKKIILQ